MIKLKSIYKSLNIEDNEVVAVLLLITQSIFIGIFYGAYDIGAHTLFLNVFPEDMIPKAYIISGLVGIVLTSTFSKFQSKIKFAKLANFSLLFISVLILLMRSMFFVMSAKWVVFILFIFFGPLNIIAILAFWGTVGRIFNLRQGKRLFGIIDTGQILGIILSSFAIPLIITFLKGTNNILLISAISILLAMVLEMVITKKFNLAVQDGNNENVVDTVEVKEENEEEVKLKDFTKNPYILYMAFFVIFSMFAAFFVQYSFLVVTKEQYPLEEDMAKYLGFFTGSMMVFTLIIKTFVYSKLMKSYGLKVSLILSPVLLGLFTLIAVVAGYFGGYDQASPGFIYFFLLISLSKLFNKTLKDALEVPSFKLLYQALAKKIRFDVQAKIDGTINEIAALASGLILYGLGVLVFVKLIHFSVVLFILLGLWTLITIRLYKEYRNNLEKSLKEKKGTNINEEISDILDNVETKLEGTNIHKYLEVCHETVAVNYIELFKEVTLKNSSIIKQLKGNKRHLLELFFLFRKESLTNEQMQEFKLLFNEPESESCTAKEIAVKIKSDEKVECLEGFSQLYNLDHKSRIPILLSLLRMPDVEIQQITIRFCGELKETETYGTLVEFLDIDSLFSDALISLRQMADKCYKQIIQVFYKTDISVTAQLSIIKLLSYVNEKEVIVFLLENLSHHRSEIFSQSIKSLINLNYRASENEQPRFFHPITEVIQTLAWDISALASVNPEKEPLLFKLLQKEFKKHQDVLFQLLSLAYDSQSVNHVREYLETGTSEGVGYALELFDIFISDEIKPIVLLIFEDMPLVEKTRQLQNHFPVEVMEIEALLIHIINRDPNLISLITKQLAINLYTKYYSEVTYDVVAHLFNPVTRLKHQAAHIINSLAPDKLPQLLKRVQLKEASEIKNIIKFENKFNSNEYLTCLAFDKLGINPVEIADYVSYNEYKEGKNIVLKDKVNDYFVFLVIDRNELTDEIENVNIANRLYLRDFEEGESVLVGLKKEEILVGIAKHMIPKLQLTNYGFIKNLITLS